MNAPPLSLLPGAAVPNRRPGRRAPIAPVFRGGRAVGARRAGVDRARHRAGAFAEAGRKPSRQDRLAIPPSGTGIVPPGVHRDDA